MNASLAIQYSVVALAVVVSIWVVMKKQFPHVTRKLRVAIAIAMLREGQPGWLRPIGRHIAPSATATGAACGGCDNCGPKV